ncbi:MAG: rfaP 1 [Planctomycetota bacterium]|nr:rfaP 1 [Planctomycetota bacterium]
MSRSHGNLLDRLTRGVRWTWLSEDYRAALPEDLDATVMDLESRDRLHAKQGRSTARIRFDSPWGPLSVYLKRHYRLPFLARLGALLFPSLRFTPGASELAHLERARSLGVAVPDTVAAGERIGPWGTLQSFLMVAELTGCRELNEVWPGLRATMTEDAFARLKRELIVEMAGIAARLHAASVFHKDLYLCHFFLDTTLQSPLGGRLTLIDLHRLAEHRLLGFRWRWKDLGQLLYSSYEVAGIDDRDRLRFWRHYREATALPFAGWQMRRVIAKAERYRKHNSGD